MGCINLGSVFMMLSERKFNGGTKKFYTPLPALFAPPFQLGTTVSQAELCFTQKYRLGPTP